MIVSNPAARPGRTRGMYPENPARESLGRAERFLQSWLLSLSHRKTSFRYFKDQLKSIEVEVEKARTYNLSVFDKTVMQIQHDIRSAGLTTQLTSTLFGLTATKINDIFGFNPHTEQLYAGWAMLQGKLPEMHTGEGKTITIAFPAITMAMTGTPVHVVTVNEYLAKRDAELLAPLYACFGLSTGIVTQDMSELDRRKAYSADIVYCTNKQVAFDYLRDQRNLDSSPSGLSFKLRSLTTTDNYTPVQRGLCFAIIDEADSVLIDEAKIPLILTEPNEQKTRSSVQEKVALGIARTLHEGVDYTLHSNERTINLTEDGKAATRSLADLLDGTWRFERYRNELIKQALLALHVYKVERDYIVRDQNVVLIDENTGRTMPDRKMQNGLHRMIEIKERCKPSDDLDTVATISYQRFFQKYYLLSGLSGTLKEVKKELQHTYSVHVEPIPPHHMRQFQQLSTECFENRTLQIARMLTIVQARHMSGQPILIGTRSVELSNRISDVLSACDITHNLLNAVQDESEAEIISKAGVPGAVTVATNMAGRGTDIPLATTSEKLGGLHVINMEFNESPRIDRQLFGRAARQGQPGSGQSILSLTDDIVDKLPARARSSFKSIITSLHLSEDSRCWSVLVRLLQWKIERSLMIQRNTIFHGYSELKRHLAVCGHKD